MICMSPIKLRRQFAVQEWFMLAARIQIPLEWPEDFEVWEARLVREPPNELSFITRSTSFLDELLQCQMNVKGELTGQQMVLHLLPKLVRMNHDIQN